MLLLNWMNKPLWNHMKHLQRYISHSSRPYNVLFFGSDDYALQCLKKLKWDMENVPKAECAVKNLEVVCLPERELIVHKFAETHHIPLHIWPDLPKKHTFDVAVVVSFGKLMPRRIINTFPLGMINVHASLLPALRGAAPIARAIENGCKFTGTTIIQIKPHRFDHGLILEKSEKIKIADETTAADLTNILAIEGSDLCLRVLKELPLKLSMAEEQTEKNATYAPKLTLEDTYINWDLMDSYCVWRKFKAYGFRKKFHLCCMFNGALTKLVVVALCTPDQLKNVSEKSIPGTIFYDKQSKQLLIACESGYIACKKLIYGKHTGKPLSANDFNNGFLQVQVKQGKKIMFQNMDT